MNQLKKALKTFIPWLEKKDVPYMVFGGLAVSVHGYPRQTFDIDIKLSLTSETEKEKFIKDLEYTATILSENPVQFIKETGVLPVEIDDVRIDLVFAELPYELEAVKRSVPTTIFDIKIRVCTAEDLIIHKAISHRSKDWLDIESVVTRQKDHLDWDYIYDNCQELADFLDRPTLIQRIKDLQHG